ncbi:MAG: acidic tetraheme cytochrome c3 TmcA [Thermodesulfobacteriota bacterium]
MKKRTLTISIVLTAMALFIAVFSASSQEDIKFVKDSAFTSRMRPPVPFTHDQHNENAQIEDCGVCHHVYQDGKRVDGEASQGTMCSECHTLQKGDNPMSLTRVYHLQCKGCHIEKKAGPVLCSECHRK